MGRSPSSRESWGILCLFLKNPNVGCWPSLIMTLTSHASTLELSIIPSLVLYFRSFSDDHRGFCMLLDLHSAVQGCTTMRCLPWGVEASGNPTGTWDSHRDKSCSALPRSQECLSQQQDSQGHSCSLHMELQRGLKASSSSTPTRDNGNAREMPAVGYTGPQKRWQNCQSLRI